MHPEVNRKAVMAWAAHYEANMAEALEARQELYEVVRLERSSNWS
jgi:hypothetical protein